MSCRHHAAGASLFSPLPAVSLPLLPALTLPLLMCQTLTECFRYNHPMPEIMPGCSLCPPTRGVVLDDDYWTLVLNENQATLGRVFFALKRHETDVSALTPDELTSLWAFLARTKAALASLFAPDHFNFMLLMNLTPHLHMHIFPRYAASRRFADETYADARFGDHYDPTETRLADDATLDALAAALRHALTQPTAGAVGSSL